MTTTLSGHSDAKGRNGYFRVVEVDTWYAPFNERVHVEVYSKTRGNSAPIRLELTAEDARALIDALGVVIP